MGPPDRDLVLYRYVHQHDEKRVARIERLTQRVDDAHFALLTMVIRVIPIRRAACKVDGLSVVLEIGRTKGRSRSQNDRGVRE